jgi:transposase InsO family protein
MPKRSSCRPLNKSVRRVAAYARAKTLVVFFHSDDPEWYPNKVAKQLPTPLLFAAVWVVGLQRATPDEYIYDVASLDLGDGHAPIFYARIPKDFDSWTRYYRARRCRYLMLLNSFHLFLRWPAGQSSEITLCERSSEAGPATRPGARIARERTCTLSRHVRGRGIACVVVFYRAPRRRNAPSTHNDKKISGRHVVARGFAAPSIFLRSGSLRRALRSARPPPGLRSASRLRSEAFSSLTELRHENRHRTSAQRQVSSRASCQHTRCVASVRAGISWRVSIVFKATGALSAPMMLPRTNYRSSRAFVFSRLIRSILRILAYLDYHRGRSQRDDLSATKRILKKVGGRFHPAPFNAVVYWVKAGQQAMGRSAATEAVAQLQNGLDLLARLRVRTVLFQTVHVFFVIRLANREIFHVAVTRHPTADWATQQIVEGCAWDRAPPRFLIHDPDSRYGVNFDRRVRGLGIRQVRTLFRSPRANAVAERWVRSVRSECLDHLIVFNEANLRRVLSAYLADCNRWRPHRWLGQVVPCDEARPLPRQACRKIVAEPVLGGLHRIYRAAA